MRSQATPRYSSIVSFWHGWYCCEMQAISGETLQGVQPMLWPPSQHGPERGLFLGDSFDHCRFLAPLGILDRNKPPGFGISSHLNCLGLLLCCLGCFPFRHVRSPQKSIHDAYISHRYFSVGSCGNLSKKDPSSLWVCYACRGGVG